jgi:hypothetical protein
MTAQIIPLRRTPAFREMSNAGTYGYDHPDMVDVTGGREGYRVFIGNRLHGEYATLSNAARAASELRQRLAQAEVRRQLAASLAALNPTNGAA